MSDINGLRPTYLSPRDLGQSLQTWKSVQETVVRRRRQPEPLPAICLEVHHLAASSLRDERILVRTPIDSADLGNHLGLDGSRGVTSDRSS